MTIADWNADDFKSFVIQLGAGLGVVIVLTLLGWKSGLFGALWRGWAQRLRPDEKTLIRWVAEAPGNQVLTMLVFGIPRTVIVSSLFLWRERERWLIVLDQLKARQIVRRIGDEVYELAPVYIVKGRAYVQSRRPHARLRLTDHGVVDIPKEQRLGYQDAESKREAGQLDDDAYAVLLATKGNLTIPIAVVRAAGGTTVNVGPEYFGTQGNWRMGETMKFVVERLTQNGWLKCIGKGSVDGYQLTEGGVRLAEYIHRQGPRPT